ncbi:polysaccharide deacetylase [Methylobacterium currus]|uniref:Chitooligosaccharide deacetylase n=1 Tax=Methylobacterium currus TaxID=2051553 RepID=A0A2R4WHI4_9HYPH|nr:polysaccharide deacetylase family protein [Methylobacterium currus]AWB20993.1 polysaccharide deacetylase [Methylobacterium currus]UHC14179.1 polysaccharide deacetylase family protein [Methylobacterium currus]
MLSAQARHRLFHAGFATIAATGADRWLAPAARGRGVILTFHHVRPDEAPPGAFAPNRLLAITPSFLDRTLTALRARGFAIIPLSDLPRRLAETGDPFAVLTFDDGYRDNLEHAAPTLRRHGAPWTLYVTHDYATGTGRLWWIELERAIRILDRVRLPEVGLDLPAGNDAQKSAAFAEAYRALRAGPEEILRAATLRLCGEAGIDAGRIAGELCLSAGELRELARDEAVTLAAHTLSHPMLAKHDDDAVRREIVDGKARLGELLGRVPEHLSYPVGDPGSAGMREFALAREAGYRTAVTTRPGHLFAGHAAHLHALPRVSVNGCFQTDAALRALLSGVPFLAWNRGRRLNVG